MKKKSCCFFFSGYYTVAAASEILKRYHIRNRIIKAPLQVKHSCQFAVLVSEADIEMAKYVFEREKVYVTGLEYMAE